MIEEHGTEFVRPCPLVVEVGRSNPLLYEAVEARCGEEVVGGLDGTILNASDVSGRLIPEAREPAGNGSTVTANKPGEMAAVSHPEEPEIAKEIEVSRCEVEMLHWGGVGNARAPQANQQTRKET